MTLLDGTAPQRAMILSLVEGRKVDVETDVEVGSGEYELERIENPWFPRGRGHYAGDWLVIKGTKTGTNESVWRSSAQMELLEDAAG